MEYHTEDKRRSLAGNVGIAFFVVAFVSVVVAFATPNWLVSDYRITSAKLERIGLWSHCFRSLKDPFEYRTTTGRFFVGCRWIYDPFTTGYDRIRGFLIPPFMVATQFFFTLCFIAALVSAIVTALYFLCWGPEHRHYVMLILFNALTLLAGGVCGAIAVIIFASTANRYGWLPGHDNNFFGWSFGLAAVGVIAMLAAAALFLTDAYIQRKKHELKESRIELQQGVKSY